VFPVRPDKLCDADTKSFYSARKPPNLTFHMIDIASKQQNDYKNLVNRLNSYAEQVQSLIDDLILSVVSVLQSQSQYPTLFSLDTDRIDRLFEEYNSSLQSLILTSESAEWTTANTATTILVNSVIEEYLDYISPTRRAAYFLTNADALAAFQKRSLQGLSLSERLWDISDQFRTQLSATISNALQRGTSAENLAREVQNLIASPATIQRLNPSILDTHAMTMRLARSEINMAYRTAEQTRWQQLDFVVGYQILLSHRHPKTDICDLLKGKYPKDFVWTGWHPCDLCFCIPILKTEKELWSVDFNDIFSTKSENEVTDTPSNFKSYIHTNHDQLAKLKHTPYFIKDNPKYVKL